MKNKYRYYIANNAGSINPNDLKPGARIFAEPNKTVYVDRNKVLQVEYEEEEMEGPYISIQQLKKRSKIFKKTAFKILRE